MNIKNILLFALVVSLSACQDVIEIDLPNAQSKPVIEASINDVDSTVEVLITNSAEFYDSTPPDLVTGANVIISDKNGNEALFQEVSDGKYSAPNFLGIRGTSYTLDVEIGEQVFQATAEIPLERIPIDSITLKFEEESIFRDEGIYPTIYYNDSDMDLNYFRIVATVNGKPFDFNRDTPDEKSDPDTSIQLYNDKFSNGLIQDYSLFYNLIPGDVLKVELRHLDKSTYDYLRTLNGVIGASGVAPADPISNFSTNALGYFGAYSSTFFEITVP